VIVKIIPNVREEVTKGRNIFIIMKIVLNTWPIMAEGQENFIIVKIQGDMHAISWISNPVAKASAQADPTRVG
jgi:hypothetical protein